MRPPQNNKQRMRGRSHSNGNNNRRGPNPLTRSYESNGPDIKVRGTAAHIAEKYVQLARDAHVASDPVAAENYLQHAEHYFRLIAAAQAALNPTPRSVDGVTQTDNSDENDDGDYDGGINDRFTYNSPQSYQVPLINASTGVEGNDEQITSVSLEQPNIDQPYSDQSEQRHYEPRHQRNDGRNSPRNDPRNEGRNSSRFEGRRDRNDRPQRNEFQRQDSPRNDITRNDVTRNDAPRQDAPRYDSSRQDTSRSDTRNNEYRPEPRSYDGASQETNRYETPRRERPFRQDRNQDRNFEPRVERPIRSFVPDIAPVQPILPSFITAPVRTIQSTPQVAEQPVVKKAPVEAASVKATRVETASVEEKAAPKPRRKRVVKTVEAVDSTTD
jgi:Domain of unknown function (DUF4167)